MTAYRIPRPPDAFSLDRDRKSRSGRHQSQHHLAFIRSLPCAVCGSRRDVEAAHIRFGNAAYGKGKTGMGTKPSDQFTVPLCAVHHRTGPDAQHNANEAEWWAARNIDPLNVAMRLFCQSGDDVAGELILSQARQGAKVVTP